MTNTLLNTPETYSSLQPFATIEELNANTTEIRARFANQMTKSTYEVLDALHRYACKFYGVSYRSKSKIADELGISRRTVIRACKALEDMGVIKQYETKRKGGDKRQSSNAVVFVPISPSHTECHAGGHTVYTPANTPKNTNTINTKDTDARVIHNDKLAIKENKKRLEFNPNDKEHLKNVLPDGWYQKASGYANDARDLYAITGELFKAKKNTNLRVEDYVEEFGEVLRRSYVSLKSGRIDPSKWYAYLFSAFNKTAILLDRKQRHAPMQRLIESAMFGVVD